MKKRKTILQHIKDLADPKHHEFETDASLRPTKKMLATAGYLVETLYRFGYANYSYEMYAGPFLTMQFDPDFGTDYRGAKIDEKGKLDEDSELLIIGLLCKAKGADIYMKDFLIMAERDVL